MIMVTVQARKMKWPVTFSFFQVRIYRRRLFTTTEKILDGVFIVENYILHTIERTKATKAPGSNKITPTILKDIRRQIYKPPSYIIH